MRERHEMVLADLIQIRAEQTPGPRRPHLRAREPRRPRHAGRGPQLRRPADEREPARGRDSPRWASGSATASAIMMRNHPEFVEGMIAASILGALFVPIDPRTRGEKLAYMLRNSGAVGVLCADTCLDELASVRDQVPDCTPGLLAIETGEQAPVHRRHGGAQSRCAQSSKRPPTPSTSPATACSRRCRSCTPRARRVPRRASSA